MFGNMGKMLKLAAEMKTKLPELKEELAAVEYSASSKEGDLTATVNGKMRLVGLDLPEGMDLSPRELADRIIFAVTTAQVKAQEEFMERFKELTGGVDLPGLSELM